ncbi:MAG: succinate--CoA ligase subunit alpha [Actinomycetota bacterium]|nr:succinate--CoA ligase subunit alpha [Actinomycetota bacterium]
MAVIVNGETRLVVQGLTGSEGSFHAGRNKDYGTKLVAGVTPGKGGTEHLGVPIFDTVAEAVKASAANSSMVFVPARFAADAILESFDAGISTIIAITEHIPAMDMARVVAYLRGDGGATLIGPNCPGVISPGKANVGIIPGEICSPGPVGLVSRSGTLVYQIVHELTQLGIGQSTCVGIGGDPVPGSDFIDVLTKFRDDPETEIVVLVGEIGGDAEERAAAWARANLGKPMVGFFAGREAPPGKRMGHAGAIVSGSQGTWQAKADAFKDAGFPVAKNPTEVAEIVAGLRNK